jgi:serine/threonine-protein kinase
MVSVAPREPPTRIGRYLMFQAFARGGMASVHLGRLTGPAGFSRLVALKLLHPIYAAEREYFTMLLDEARLTSRIVHPNVVQTLDVVHEAGRLCIVMEYVHGVSLANALNLAAKRRERVPPPIAAAVLVGVLHGLHAAHEARGEDGTPLGIVHRDISPQNIVVGADGVARVLDFGVAKALRKETVTREGHIKGKIGYIAPEQLTGSPVTRQADIRAAGVVLWETLVGARLFEEDNEARLITRVLTEEIPPPSHAAPGVSEALDRVVLKAVAFSKRTRFETAEEMAEALAAAVPPATREEVAAWIQRTASDLLDARAQLVRVAEATADPRPTEAAPADATASGTAVLAPADDLAAPRARRRRAAIVAAVVVACGAAAFVRLARAPSAGPATGSPVASGASVTSAAELESASPAATAPPAAPTTLVLDPVVVPTGKPRTRGVQRPVAQSPGARAACDPPYSIDADGMKHYKASCLP